MAGNERDVRALIHHFESRSNVEKSPLKEQGTLSFFKPKPKSYHAEQANHAKALVVSEYQQLEAYNQTFERLLEEQKSLLKALTQTDFALGEDAKTYAKQQDNVDALKEHIEARKRKMESQLAAWPNILKSTTEQNDALKTTLKEHQRLHNAVMKV